MRPAFLTLALLLAACDGLFVDCSDYGEFTAAVRGALTLDLHGHAISLDRTDRAAFDLSLQRRGVNYAGHIGFDVEGARRAIGTFRVEDGLTVRYDIDSRTEQVFRARSGSLSIEAIDADDVTGSFSFEAIDGNGAVVAVAGRFRADARSYPHLN
ncbi:hypothetical protein [Rubrivirga sp. IMCC43871]|uniref:hypothetical protein n=1 Tax=Rubrivirga sp. IMCC43871 TaxID=3391575 RepID=UPI00398FC0A2